MMNFGSFLRKREREKASQGYPPFLPTAAPGPSTQGCEFTQSESEIPYDGQYQNYPGMYETMGHSLGSRDHKPASYQEGLNGPPYYQEQTYGSHTDGDYHSYAGMEREPERSLNPETDWQEGDPEVGYDKPMRHQGQGHTRFPISARGQPGNWGAQRPMRRRRANYRGMDSYDYSEEFLEDTAEAYEGYQSFTETPCQSNLEYSTTDHGDPVEESKKFSQENDGHSQEVTTITEGKKQIDKACIGNEEPDSTTPHRISEEQTSEEKSKEKQGDENVDDDGEESSDSEDDETSKALKTLPADHKRGLMGTLISMMGPEALNRKPDPLPPPRPAKLKNDFADYPKHKAETTTKDKVEDETKADDSQDKEGFDPMDLPAEERDLNPNDIGAGDKGPNSELYCKICKVMTTSAKNLQAHLDGKSHKAKLAGLSSGKIINVQRPNRKKIIMAVSDLGKRSLLLEDLKDCKDSPILGLSFVTEYQTVNQVMCVCNLCGVKFDIRTAVSHVSGSKHKYQYLKEKKPAEYVHLRRFGGKKSEWTSFLEELCIEVEKNEKRGKPVLKVFDDPVKNKDAEDVSDPEDNESVNNTDAEQNPDMFFYKWVEKEYKKSKEAYVHTKSSSWRNDNDWDRGKGHFPDRRGFKARFIDHPWMMEKSQPHRPRFPDDGPRHLFDHPDLPDYHYDPLYGPPRPLYDPPYPLPPPMDPHYTDPYMELRDYNPLPKPGYSAREAACLPPHLDPDPVRRLDALKKARQELDPLNRVPPRKENYMDPDPLKRVGSTKQVLDPDPLKRVLKRDVAPPPMVIDYSHGGSKERSQPPHAKRSGNTWDDDIETILGQDKYKKPDGLAMLSNTYSSPERSPVKEEKKPSKKLPFSRSYLDLPQNRGKFRKDSLSPPLKTKKYNVSPLQSKRVSSSSSRSPSPSSKKFSNKISKASPAYGKPAGSFHRQDSSLNRYRRQSRSRSPVRGRASLRIRTSRSPGKPNIQSRSRSPVRGRASLRDKMSRSPVRPHIQSRSRSPVRGRASLRDKISRSPVRSHIQSRSKSPARGRASLRDKTSRSPGRPGKVFSSQQKTSTLADWRRDKSIDEEKIRDRSRGSLEQRNVPPKSKSKEEMDVIIIDPDSPVKDTSAVDDSEDAQAERIADMLLKMSSSIATQGDTQATLQALLSNPEVTQTIMEAQAKLAEKPEKNLSRESSAAHSHTSRSPFLQGKGMQETRKQKEAPTRERVAFSLGSKNSLRQPSAFAASSDEET